MVRNIEIRSVLGEACEVSTIRTKARAFDAWMQFSRHSQLSKQKKYKAHNFLKYNLRRKGLSALFMHKLQCVIDHKVTQQIQVIRRKNKFVKWFNYIHQIVQLEKIAD